MTPRPFRRAALLAFVGLAVAAAPAAATDPGTPPGGGQPLPNTLQPVTVQQPVPARPAAPRVTRAKVAPRRVRHGRRARVRVNVATTGQVRVVVERKRRGRLVRVWARTVPVPASRVVSVRLPGRLSAGTYRVSLVSISDAGALSRTVNRSLRVLKKR